MKPLISVVLPVYNSESYLGEAVESILDQTMPEFELIIVNDGSSDGSREIIDYYALRDNRIKVITFPENRGNYTARNEGNRNSSGKYICIMDSDDISMPERLQTQFKYMESHPDIGIAGSGFININGTEVKPVDNFNFHECIKIRLMAGNIFCNPTLIMNKELLDKHRLSYNESFCYAGDYDHLTRAVRCFKIINMEEVLLKYRRHHEQISSKHAYAQQYYACLIIINYISDTLNIKMTADEKDIHFRLMRNIPIEQERFDMVIAWINKILTRNADIQHFDHKHLKLFLIGKLKNLMGKF